MLHLLVISLALAVAPSSALDEEQVHRSTTLCWNQRVEKLGLQAIADEREAANIGGVVDLAAIGRAQRAVAGARKHIKADRAALKAAGRRPLPCDDNRVAYLMACIENYGDARKSCQDEEWRAFWASYLAD